MRPDIDGAAAPPRKNGELVFAAPWEGRAFGMAVALRERGVYDWNAFRDRLIAAIAAADCKPEGERPAYNESWLAALERLLVDTGVLTRAEIEARVEEFEHGERDIVNPTEE